MILAKAEVRVLESFSIEGFRGFRAVQLDGLKRLNLVVGRNSAGKSSLLEALLVHSAGSSNPMVAINALGLRGIRVIADVDEVWASWAPAGLAMGQIRLTGRRIGHPERTTSLTRQELDVAPRELGTVGFVESAPARPAIRVSDQRGTARTHADVFKDGDDWRVTRQGEQPSVVPLGKTLFLGARGSWSESIPDVLSDLIRAGEDEAQVTSVLRSIEPRLQRLLVLSSLGRPAVYGDLGTFRAPLMLLGDGLNRMLALLLGARQSAQGLLLVDEVENGFHHSVLVDVWLSLAEAARASNVQVFATTHSAECIAAAVKALRGTTDLAMIQLERKPEGVSARVHGPDVVEAAIDADIEVR